MYVATSSLPHLLSPQSYSALPVYEREMSQVLRPSWHLVTTTSSLSQTGDFVTAEILGEPVHLRNFDGKLTALSNVCVHRHCLLTSQPNGNSPTMRCQYHGWEFAEDGRTRRIPAPKNFVPFDRDEHRLENFRVDQCGQLVFVSLASSGPSLREYMGDFFDLCATRFSDNWQEFLHWEPEIEANWKIPIENSLEAYHVPCIHSETFREDPGPERSAHRLLPHRTSLETSLPFSAHSQLDRWFQQGEGWLMRRLGVTPTANYAQHHVFPNLLFSFTDAISLVECVLPLEPRRTRAVIRQFGRIGDSASGPRRWLARAWGQLASAVTKRVVREDLALFADIQRGLDSSNQCGLLGICEERIYAFQQFLERHCGKVTGLTRDQATELVQNSSPIAEHNR